MTEGLLKKSDLENVQEGDKETAEEIDREFKVIFKEMLTETSALMSTLDLFKDILFSVKRWKKQMIPGIFGIFFTDKVMLPYVML